MTIGALSFRRNGAKAGAIAEHLRQCDTAFVPPLSTTVDLEVYAKKIAANAERFEAWSDDQLAGLVAAYCNDPARITAFVTNVSVLPTQRGKGVAGQLMRDCIINVRQAGFQRLDLEVDERNLSAYRLYHHLAFVLAEARGTKQLLRLTL